jgi:2-iminobutanoate/2-iminopropanoate deaminase
MPREAIAPHGLFASSAPLSPVICSGDLVVVSGQVPFDAEGRVVSEDFVVQARRVFDNMGRCLQAAGCTFDDVLKVSVFLTDLDDFQSLNDVYREYFSEPYPARTTVQVGLRGFRIEADALARRSTARPRSR